MGVVGNIGGLDLSLRGTGLCVLCPDGEVLETLTFGYGLEKGARPKEKVERHVTILKEIISCFRKHEIKHLVVEDYAWSRKSGRQIDLAELRGAVGVDMWRLLHVEMIPASISSARSVVLGKGNIAKSKIKPKLESLLGIVFGDHNAADAYVVAEWYRQQLGAEPAPSKQGDLFDG